MSLAKFSCHSYEPLIEFTGSWYYNFYQKNGNIFEYTYEQIQKYEKYAIQNQLSWTI